MSASFEEKSVWIQLCAMLIGLGTYFVIAGRLLASGVREVSGFAALFIVAVVWMVVLMIIAYVVAALTSKTEGRDERDRLIAWKAEHRSAWVMAVGMNNRRANSIKDLVRVFGETIMVRKPK